MTLNLKSALAKLGRAHEHAQAVKSEIKAWGDSNPYMITRERNAELTRHSLIAHVGSPPPLLRWTLMVGDAVHNLRSALEHLVYAIGVYEADGKEPPPGANSLAFPICESPEVFADRKTRVKTLSAPVQAVIERCQPYNRRHKELPPLLLILNKFENTDKHKLLRLAFSSMAAGEVGFVGPTPDGTIVKNYVNMGAIYDGAEVVAYTTSVPCPHVKFDRFNLLLIISMMHDVGPNGNDRTDVPSLLTLLHKEVRDVIDEVAMFTLIK
jgi:hypothetical protein